MVYHDSYQPSLVSLLLFNVPSIYFCVNTLSFEGMTTPLVEKITEHNDSTDWVLSEVLKNYKDWKDK